MVVASVIKVVAPVAVKQISVLTVGPQGSSMILGQVDSVDGKATGATNILTAPAELVVVAAIIRPSTATAITAPPVIGIGVAAGEDDIFFARTLLGLTSIGTVYVFNATGIVAKVASGGIIKIGIDTGATGTTLTLSVDLLGYRTGQ